MKKKTNKGSQGRTFLSSPLERGSDLPQGGQRGLIHQKEINLPCLQTVAPPLQGGGTSFIVSYLSHIIMNIRMYSRNRVTMREKRIRRRRWMVGNTLRVITVTMITLFGFLYVIQTNASSAKGYALSDLENQIRDLKREEDKLEVEIATHQSMQKIQERLPDTDLVAVDKVEYLTAVGQVVAQR